MIRANKANVLMMKKLLNTSDRSVELTAKGYLSQVRDIDGKLKRLQRNLESLKADMYSIKSTTDYDADKVQTSIVGDKLLNLIAKVDEMQQEIMDELVNLEKKKSIIISQIESLDDERYRTILHDRYICFMKWEEIAVDMHRDIRYVYRLHGRALQEFQREVLP